MEAFSHAKCEKSSDVLLDGPVYPVALVGIALLRFALFLMYRA